MLVQDKLVGDIGTAQGFVTVGYATTGILISGGRKKIEKRRQHVSSHLPHSRPFQKEIRLNQLPPLVVVA